MFSLAEILDIAVQLEKNGEAYYRKACGKNTDPRLVAKLTWLADQEAAHAGTFLAMKAALAGKASEARLDEMGKRLLRQTVGDQGFSLTQEALADVQKPEKLLGLAVEFERDTILFYELLRTFIKEPETLELMDAILAEEQGHVRELNALLVRPRFPEPQTP